MELALQIAQLAFYSLAGLAIGIGGAAAIFKWKRFRTGRAFLTIAIDASSRPCSTSHNEISVTAKLYNGSRVVTKANTIEWTCRGVAPYDPAIIEGKVEEYFPDDDHRARVEDQPEEFPWNILQRITRHDSLREIEPGETGTDTVAFIIPKFCTAVHIRAFIPEESEEGKKGWTGVTTHDLKN